ncbi:uncharacterized protein GGS25DRAFT_522665 [Hypoxylon fragiforme]|uniref:uncharacterized protein n=1 Tax=Hypoxylon fragiforme TaxID=63214 RepID=UPI0020C64727|nr:uncharacterized protein GGS25DRAFT_522665 [Hypoxylon fragiforme]KAI2607147.1 hypothetical protein GGS25DRAFT_522665 [Hypoxylon fragiforme]
MSTHTELGAIIVVTEPKEGDNVWIAKQTGLGKNQPPRNGDPRSNKCFDWSFEVVTLSGCVDTDNFGLTVTVSVMGFNLGTFGGNLKDGIVVKVDLFLVSGEMKFYLKNRNELWVHLNLKVKWDGSWDTDLKILSF